MDPDGPMHLSQAVKRIGICEDMCPEYERVRRIVEEDLKLPEYVRLLHGIPVDLAECFRRRRV